MARIMVLAFAAVAFLILPSGALAAGPCGSSGWKMVTPGHRVASPHQFSQSGGRIYAKAIAGTHFLPNVQYWVTHDTGLQTYSCSGGSSTSLMFGVGINQKAGTYLFAVSLSNPVSLPHTPALFHAVDPILLAGHGSRIGRATAEAGALHAASHDHHWSGRRVRDAVLARVYSQTLRMSGQTEWVVSLSVRPENTARSLYLVFVDPHSGRVVNTLTRTSAAP